MLPTFLATLSPMLVMFVCILLGFAAKKLKLTPDNTATVLSKLENYFLVPALILNTFMEYCTVASIQQQYRLVLYCAAVLALALAISIPLSRLFSRQDAYRRNIYKYALTFGNFSFMGNAIVPAILGQAKLYEYMLYILPLNVAVYTWGLVILIPHEAKTDGKQPSVWKNLLNPIFVSILVGMVLGLTNVKPHLPAFVTTSIANCAACMGPLAMILTGFVIGGYSLPSLLKNKRVYFATALRLLLLPTLFVGLLWLVGASTDAMVLTLFAFGTPLGLNTVVFPAAYGGDTETGASMAMISHTLCVLTIPALYALLTVLLA